jgi:26S proteasome regulatory subunit RPN6 N-terminal domain
MAPPPTNEQKLAEAKRIAKSEPRKAESLYKEVLSKPPGSNEAALRDYENALVGLGELYRDLKRQEDLAELVKTSRSALSSFAKAKTAKLGMGFCPFNTARADSF